MVAREQQPDLFILDVNLPDLSGTELCDELRRLHVSAPIMMVTGLHQIEDRVRGLEAGADDYLTKPFDARELIARVTALLRRHQRTREHPHVLICGEVRIDFGQGAATRDGTPIHLTKTEFALLELLATEHGRVVSRKTILDTVWGYARTPDTRTVDTHVWRLRKKIGDSGENPRWLKLVAGQGYRLDDCVIEPGSAS